MQGSQAVFIVGYPRSDTKLLRGLLNNHPHISLGDEGNFIPLLIDQFGIGANVSDTHMWPKIYQAYRTTADYNTQKSRGKEPSETAFLRFLETRKSQSEDISWADILEGLFRASSAKENSLIFGDKSHNYVQHVPLIRSIFTDVRFILIIRDPRDQALSVAKTWGRNPLRSAQGWSAMARKAEKYDLNKAHDSITVRYEDLTADPHKELDRICTLLQIPSIPELAVLKKSVEPKHLNRHFSDVVSQSAKYKQAFPPKTIKNISEITLPYLATYGYPDEGATRHRELGKFRLKWLKYRDGLASLLYHMREKRILAGFTYYRRRHFEAGS